MEKEFCLMEIGTLNLNLLNISKSDIQPLLNSLTIYPESQAELEFCGGKVRLAVIGESHFMMVDELFFELLVCEILPQSLFKGIMALERKCGTELGNFYCSFRETGFNYYFKSHFIDYWHGDKNIVSEGSVVYECEEKFPFEFEGREISCKTKLRLCQTNARTLCLHSMHDYPVPDGVTVVTKSIWNFPQHRRS